MGTHLPRFEANERVDLIDFAFLAKDAFQNAARQIPAKVLTDESGVDAGWIFKGFEMANPSGLLLQVTKGVAVLSDREGAIVSRGMITTEGDASKTVDMTAFADATYYVYLRFEYVDSDTQGRIFWDAAGAGSEFSQTMATRRSASWSVRIETSSPGGEWLRIGRVVKATGSLTLTDQRPMYWEGAVDTSYAPTWGAGNDRSADRATHGVHDLRQFTSAVRTRLTELSGREWWKANLDGTGVSAKAEEADFFADDCWTSGYAATNPSGLTIRVTSGVAYSSGRRIAISNATPLGYINLTMIAAGTRYVELTSAGVLQLSASPTELTLWQVVSAGGAVTQLNDYRLRVPRRYSGAFVLANAASLTWMNAAGTGTDGELYLDSSNVLIQNMALGGNFEWWSNNHAAKIGGLATAAGVTTLDLIGASAAVIHMAEDDAPADWYWIADGGYMILRKDSTAIADNVLRLASSATNTAVTFWSDLSGGGGANDTYWQAYTDSAGYAVMDMRDQLVTATVANRVDPIYRLTSRNTSLYWEWRIDTSAVDALQLRTAAGVWLWGSSASGVLGVRRLVAGEASANIDTYLDDSTDTQFVVQTDSDSSDPTLRILRGSAPDSSGALDFTVSNAYGNRIMSRAKALHMGTIANANWHFYTNDLEQLRITSGGRVLSNAYPTDSISTLDAHGWVVYGDGSTGHWFYMGSENTAHGITGLAPTNVAASFAGLGASGGMQLAAYGGGAPSLSFLGSATTPDTETTANTFGSVAISGAKKSGTTLAASAYNETAVSLHNNTGSNTAVAAFKGRGTGYLFGTHAALVVPAITAAAANQLVFEIGSAAIYLVREGTAPTDYWALKVRYRKTTGAYVENNLDTSGSPA